jgi:hypothetical protein
MKIKKLTSEGLELYIVTDGIMVGIFKKKNWSPKFGYFQVSKNYSTKYFILLQRLANLLGRKSRYFETHFIFPLLSLKYKPDGWQDAECYMLQYDSDTKSYL